MTSQGDTNLCSHINTPSYTVWRSETCLSWDVPSGDTYISLFHDRLVDGASENNLPCYVFPIPNRDLSGPFCTIFEPMVFHIPGFGTFWLNKRANNSNACFAIQIKGITTFWLRVVHGKEGVSDRGRFLSVEEHPSCFRLFWWGRYIFLCL